MGENRLADKVLITMLSLTPKKRGGALCIALLCSLTRPLMKMANGDLRGWHETFAQEGDTAAPGTSASHAVSLMMAKLEP